MIDDLNDLAVLNDITTALNGETGMSVSSTGARQTSENGPAYILHPSFEEMHTEEEYATVEIDQGDQGHLSDEQTRMLARAMHFAAHKMAQSSNERDRKKWEQRYYNYRDEIIVGNRKLIYRAVHRWAPRGYWTDDMIGQCQIVFIQSVAAYNPWIGIRFSTYAFTCLIRALSRLSRRQSNDRLANSLPLDIFPEGEPGAAAPVEAPETRLGRIYEFLQENHPLLTDREKRVIIRRFNLDGQEKKGTLTQVGKELGLSKERARQLQITALDKIRQAIKETSEEMV